MLGRCLAELGRATEAEALFTRALAAMTEMRGPDHPDVRACAAELAKVRAESSDD